MKGFIPEIVKLTNQYGLSEFLDGIVFTGTFPNKHLWKNIVRNNVRQVESAMWKVGLQQKDPSGRVLRVLGNLTPYIMYKTARKNIILQRDILNLARFIAIPPQEDEETICNLCERPFFDLVEHVFVRCESLNMLRNDMWDSITNVIGCINSVHLTNLPDEDTMEILLGKPWNPPDPQIDEDCFIYTVAEAVKHMVRKIIGRS
jgi:hypothetical protein